MLILSPTVITVSKFAGELLTVIWAASPCSPFSNIDCSLSKNFKDLPVLPINLSGLNPINISESATVNLFELNNLTFSPFTVTHMKSLPFCIYAIIAIPNGVIASGPLSFLILVLIF